MNSRGPAHADGAIEAGATLTGADLIDAARPLSTLTAEDIAEAIASARDDWDVTNDERVEFAKYLWKRRANLLSAYAAPPAAAKPRAQESESCRSILSFATCRVRSLKSS